MIFCLFSANLAPGEDYAAGMKKSCRNTTIRSRATGSSAFLFDLGVEPRDGELRFSH
jgi:hypothetical protein